MAVDVSRVHFASPLGRLLRAPLRLIPAEAKMPILQGPLRGRKWIAGSHIHGCWLGTYELNKQERFVRHVRAGDVVWDIGANVGFYTLLSSWLAGPTGKVVAFEPLPRNLRFLRDHVKINALTNVEIIDAAVSDRAGTAEFVEGDDGAQGHLSDIAPGGKRHTVKLVSIDGLLSERDLPRPTLVKIDVEGAEAAVIRGARALLSESHPTIFLATHGPAVHAECLSLLSDLGYTLNSLSDKPLDQTDEILAEKPT